MLGEIKKINFLITKRQRLGLILLAGLLFIGMIMEVLGLGILLPVISIILDSEIINKNDIAISFSEFFGIESHLQFVFSFLMIIVLIYLIKTIFLIYITYKQNRFLNNITAYISNKLFSKYLKAPFSFHLATNSASLIKNIQIEVAYFQIYCLALVTIFIEGGLVFSVIATLIYIEPLGAISIGLFFGVLSFLFFSSFKTRLKKWGIYREHLDEKISKIAIESLSLVKDLKVLGRENFFIKNYSEINYVKSRLSANHATIIQLPRFFLELVSIVGLVAFIFLMLFKGENPNTLITTLGVFIAATFRAIPSLNRILGAFQNLKYYNKSIELLYNEMQIEDPLNEDDTLEFKFENEIIFENINFKYNAQSDYIFNSLNLKIKKGETIGLIGSSGSGKSTFVDILIGLLKPSSGNILVDGKVINKSISSWQKKIGYISQDIHLIDDSIINNISLGIEEHEINLERINLAIKSAQLESFINKLPKGIETHVGDKGVQISGGQKQRIGLARALYNNPEILILDEATSSLDNETETEVMKAIELLSENKTIIIIAHRYSTLSFCDRTFELINSNFKEVKS